MCWRWLALLLASRAAASRVSTARALNGERSSSGAPANKAAAPAFTSKASPPSFPGKASPPTKGKLPPAGPPQRGSLPPSARGSSAIKSRDDVAMRKQMLKSTMRLAEGPPAQMVIAGVPSAQKSVLELLNLDRGAHSSRLKPDEGGKTKLWVPGGKGASNGSLPLYKFLWIGAQREFQLDILFRGLQRLLAEAAVDDGTFLDGVLTGDRTFVGHLEEDEVPTLLGILQRLLEVFSEEELELPVQDEIILLRKKSPKAFETHFSGLSKLTSFLLEVGKRASNNPKARANCLVSRFAWKETLEGIGSRLEDKRSYYDTKAVGRLVQLLEAAVVGHVRVMLNEMEAKSFPDKPIAVQREFTAFERALRDKATPRGTKELAVDGDLQFAVVPLLYVFNVLIKGNIHQVAKHLKEVDAKWSPTYGDVFLRYMQKNKVPDANVTYLRAVSRSCGMLARFEPLQNLEHGLGAEVLQALDIRTQVQSCVKHLPELADDWKALSSTVEETVRQLSAIEAKIFAASGTTVPRLAPESGHAGREKMIALSRRYAEARYTAGGPPGENDLLPPQALLDDFTLRNGLNSFCQMVTSRWSHIGSFYTASFLPESVARPEVRAAIPIS